ncbi:MAG TPA: HRDC domain-containing protein, partial [Candidatus Wallbacteria bacterium]|nr:HRDC domain-containing protein [Candidatus Wallbacteria bacterium]
CFDAIPSYGALKEFSAPAIKDLISSMAASGYLTIDESVYRTISLSEKGAAALENEETIMIKHNKGKPEKKRAAAKQPAKPTSAENAGDMRLFDILKALRRELADKQRVPPYLIFSDAALNGMCSLLPSTAEEFLEVSGVGQNKLRRYGKIFMAEIEKFVKSKK